MGSRGRHAKALRGAAARGAGRFRVMQAARTAFRFFASCSACSSVPSRLGLLCAGQLFGPSSDSVLLDETLSEPCAGVTATPLVGKFLTGKTDPAPAGRRAEHWAWARSTQLPGGAAHIAGRRALRCAEVPRRAVLNQRPTLGQNAPTARAHTSVHLRSRLLLTASLICLFATLRLPRCACACHAAQRWRRRWLSSRCWRGWR